MVELIVVTVLIGLVASLAIPRALKTTPRQEANRAARQLARDLEQVRTQAVSAKRTARMKFDVSGDFYTAFMDISDTRDGTIQEIEEEVRESRLVARGNYGGLPGVELPKTLKFGSGDASAGPLGGATSDPITLDSDQVEFNSRGMVMPLGSSGVIFLEHENDPSAVTAVTISGAGAFQAWRYIDGRWER